MRRRHGKKEVEWARGLQALTRLLGDQRKREEGDRQQKAENEMRAL